MTVAACGYDVNRRHGTSSCLGRHGFDVMMTVSIIYHHRPVIEVAVAILGSKVFSLSPCVNSHFIGVYSPVSCAYSQGCTVDLACKPVSAVHTTQDPSGRAYSRSVVGQEKVVG